MKLTKREFNRIVKEELRNVLQEGVIGDDEGYYEMLQRELSDASGGIRARYNDDEELKAALGAVFARMEELERERERKLDVEDVEDTDRWAALERGVAPE